MEFSDSISYQLRQRLLEDGSLLSLQEWEQKQDENEKYRFRHEPAIPMRELLEHLRQHSAQELARAALQNHSGQFLRLLAAGAGVNDRDEAGATALHLVFWLGRPRMGLMIDGPSGVDAVGRLLEAGADPDAATPDGTTPLQLALQFGRLAAVRQLRGAGALHCAPLALDPAPRHEPEASRDAVAVFVAGGGDLEMSPGGPMAEMDDWEETIYRKIATWEIEAQHDASTLLTGAVASDDLDLVKALIEAGASWEAAREALHQAAANASIEMMRHLLALGWNVRAPDEALKTPLERLLERFSSNLSHSEDRLEPKLLAVPVPRWVTRAIAERVEKLDRFLSPARFLLEAGAEVRFEALSLAAYDVEMFELLWPHAPQMAPEAATQLMLRLIYTPDSTRRPDATRLRFIEALLERGADANFNHYPDYPEDALYFCAKALNDEPLCRVLEAAGANTQLPEEQP